MVRISIRVFVLSLLATALFSASAMAQSKPLDGSEIQRLDVMRDKLDRMKRSLSAAAGSLKDENSNDKSKKNDKANLDSPLGRMLGLEKEASKLLTDANNQRGRIDRGDKHEKADVDSLEQAVSELQARVETVQAESAAARANPNSRVGQVREVKKKKKFLGIFGGGSGDDEYDELMGSVIPGRDRELFIVATREVRKKNYDVGRLLFQTIITTYPDSQYLPMSKLAVADSFFLEGSTSALIQAIAAYQDWLTFFPTHPLADRVVLKIAEAEMRQIGLPDRDATPQSVLRHASRLFCSNIRTRSSGTRLRPV
ncbi:MAG: outer membrane protein assembly factor BamD [Chloracidobacterium sp.]|nr:outer membrane protein assembly factor BamD [Chloracidobacterium sp.]